MAPWRCELNLGHNVFLSQKPALNILKTSNTARHSTNWIKTYKTTASISRAGEKRGGDGVLPAEHEQGQRRTPDSGERPVD